MNNILLLGGSGFVGRSVCEALVEDSSGGTGRISVPSRRPQRAKALSIMPSVEVVNADLYDDTELMRLVAGRDAVINLVAILHGSESEFARVHVELPRRLARACAATGVRRVLHVSALGAALDAPSRYLRSKAAGEAVLREAGLDLTLFRPSVIFGAQDRFMNLFAALQTILPLLPLAGADARFQPVWVNDVAQAMAHALAQPGSIGQTYELTGPRVYTLRELVRLAGLWSGHPRPVIALPAGLARLQATLMECLPGETLMSRDNLDSMQVPSVASGRFAGLDALGVQATPLEAVMPEWLAHAGEPARLDAWRRLAGRS